MLTEPVSERTAMSADTPPDARFAPVTGGSRGIGRALALAPAERGTDVAVHYHTRDEAAAEVLAEVRARGADGFTVRADVTRERDVRCMLERVGA
jgi:3-oxoacyl-[acyl-carrier protein] reductase